jgi:hypothetical protein
LGTLEQAEALAGVGVDGRRPTPASLTAAMVLGRMDGAAPGAWKAGPAKYPLFARVYLASPGTAAALGPRMRLRHQPFFGVQVGIVVVLAVLAHNLELGARTVGL